MILKQHPDDFFVEELTDVVPGEQGPFALYRLEKKGWTTPDALQAVRRRWKVDHRRMSYGGLKDRHAHTIQYVTIYRGPERKLTHQAVGVTYLGHTDRPFTSQNIVANRFRLVLRDFSDEHLQRAEAALSQARDTGVPNYFDDQRFGSVAGHGQFMAKSLLRGEYEEALRTALTAPYPHDRAPQKKEKNILRALWGDWQRCKDTLGRSHARSLVDYLVHHPQDFRGAVVRLRPELRGLYLSAYQSHLWNRMLAAWLRDHLVSESLINAKLRLGEYPMPRILEPSQQEQLERLELPLPSARIEWATDDPRKLYFDRVLAEEELTPDNFRLRGLKELFFSRGERSAHCMPRNLESVSAPDEAHAGRMKLTLSFELPRGSYATLLVKRITAEG